MNAATRTAIIEALLKIAGCLQGNEPNPGTGIKVLESCIEDRELSLSAMGRSFVNYASSFVPPNSHNESSDPILFNIITISASSSIVDAIRMLTLSTTSTADQIRAIHIDLTILESRPLFEGANMAKTLLELFEDLHRQERGNKRSFTIRIAPESHMLSMIRAINSSESSIPTFILLGADCITPSGHVVNKMGSANLAFIAHTLVREESRRVIVLSDADKIDVPSYELLQSYKDICAQDPDHGLAKKLSRAELNHPHSEYHDAREIFAAWDEQARSILEPYVTSSGGEDKIVKVEVQNNYFELINTENIDEFIGVEGPVSRDIILKTSIERAEKEAELFGNLYE